MTHSGLTVAYIADLANATELIDQQLEQQIGKQ